MYMNDTSKYIVQLVTAYNSLHSSPRLAYTFDAGPNAVLFTPGENIGEILGLVQYYIPPESGAAKYHNNIVMPTIVIFSFISYVRGVSAGQAVPPTPPKVFEFFFILYNFDYFFM